MNKEALACDPARWQRQTSPFQIEDDLTFYGLEHGRPPEYLGVNGVFITGYYYRLNERENTIHSFNPRQEEEFEKDVREMFDISTPRGRQEKEGFEKLTRLFFKGAPGDVFLWISPAEEGFYQYPRLYFAQKKEANLIEAYDLNTDLGFADLKKLLSLLSNQKITVQNNQDILSSPLLISQEELQIIFTSLRKIGVENLHNVPLEIIEKQFQEKAWEKPLLKNRPLASKASLRIWESVNEGRLYQARLWVAWYEEAIRREGGFFAPQSSCGTALASILALNPQSYYGQPFFGLEIIPRTKVCPACGWPLLTPVPVGGHCPHCGTERKC